LNELRELYQELILDHSKKPRNFHALSNASRKVEGYNPLCGDRYTIYVALEGNLIKDVGFEGAGCAISKASASMMTAAIKGKTAAEAKELFDEFHKMVSGKPGDPINESKLGKLSVFSGVSEFPIRVKCATLAWHTVKSAIEGNEKTVSTE
jgi:nitrogen fixation protein NifU and related proteins